MSYLLLHTDARALPLKDRSVQCVVTSPPYWGLRDYGMGSDQLGLEPIPDLYVQHLVEIFQEVWRVLRDDGTVWLNLGDSHNAAGRSGHGTRVGYKQGTNRTSADRNRPSADALKPKDLIGIPWRVAFALQVDGWYLRSDIIWAKPNPMPESVRDRPTRSHEYVFLLSKSAQYYYDSNSVKEPSVDPVKSAKRYEKPFTGNRLDPTSGCLSTQNPDGVRTFNGNRNRRSVWFIPTQPYRGAHFATFPEKLVEPCVLAGCPEGSVVLDPFCGSGTVLKVSERLGRIGIGMDLKEEYLQLARIRIHGEKDTMINKP